MPTQRKWAIAIHGGAGRMTPETLSPQADAVARSGLSSALHAGLRLLREGGSALDAVTAAVAVLEDDPTFNAGRGSVLTFDGHVELDAAVMDGRARTAGAVAGLRRTKSPVTLARKVMEAGPHVFLSGEGAERFARDHAIEAVDPAWFITPERRAQWEEFRSRKDGWFDAGLKYGTVGAVALDQDGHLAAATSTGGLTGKRWGRIGDSPLPGAGTWADDRACAVSATGSGEVFIRTGAAHEIAARIRLAGDNAQMAADAVMAEVGALGGEGGVIFVSPDGTPGYSFNTPGMYRARASSDGLAENAIFQDERMR
ncbi:MAG: isoaspartyl peptidase/L-asparaginase [Novosphingobium sp.]